MSNFVRGFEAFRPATFNLTALWNSGEAGASGVGILHLWTELGILAVILVGWLLVGVVQKLRQGARWWWLFLAMVVTLYLPLQLVSLFLMIFLLSMTFDSKTVKLVLKVGDNGLNVMPAVVGVISLLLVLAVSFMSAKGVLANYYLWRSAVAAAKNDGGATYQYQIKAIGMDGNNAELRRIYSQTNMALAKSLLANKDITDDDKQKSIGIAATGSARR